MKALQRKSGIQTTFTPTPKWLQRGMLLNLKIEAKNRISKEWAVLAQKILNELENHKADDAAPVDIPVHAAETQTPVMNHQPIPDRGKNNNRYSIVGKAFQCFQSYLGRLWKR